jgi:hypothetical protein
MSNNALDVAAYKEAVFGKEQAATAVATTEPSETAPTETPATAEAPAIPITTEIKPEEKIDPVIYLKEQLGYDSWEAAKADKEAFEKLKEAPPTHADFKFENDESRKIAHYIKEGKRKELRTYLETQDLVEEFASKTDEQKLKTFLKIQNPLYDQELLDARFAKEYSFDESKFKDEDGNITDQLAFRMAKIDAQQKMQVDLQKAAEFISQQKTKIVLPDITPAAAPVDQNYASFQASLKAEEENQKLVDANLAKVTEKETVYTQEFSDEASKLNVKISYQPTKESFAKAKAAVSDIFEFLNTNYRSKDGSPLTTQLVQDLALVIDRKEYTNEVIIQATNAERRRMLAQAKNIQESTQRNYNPVVKSDVDLLREQVYGKTA